MFVNLKSVRRGLFLASLLVAAIALVGCGRGGSGTITVAGSTTVQPLAQKLAEAFMDGNPSVRIDVQGGGTSVGIQACNDGTVDIGAASRELKDSEPALVKHLLARDGIAIVTNSRNTVNGLTKDQVKKIFAGSITKWSEVGGANERIGVYAREEGSGTRGAFEELVMGSDHITSDAVLQNSNGFLRTAVAGDANAVGFLSFGYVDSSVKTLAIDGVAAAVADVKSGSYPIARPLYLLTKQEPTEDVKEYINFCLGAEGQKLVEEEGYISAL